MKAPASVSPGNAQASHPRKKAAQREAGGGDLSTMTRVSLNPRQYGFPAVYLCQPAVDRPRWLARAVGLQVEWARFCSRQGRAAYCHLLTASDARADQRVPLFRRNMTPLIEEAAQVRKEQPHVRLMVQSRIWSSSASGDDPWGEVRIIRLGGSPVELAHLTGGGSPLRWRRWAWLVAREVGAMLGLLSSRGEETLEEIAMRSAGMATARLDQRGRATLRAHGLTTDPVWAGLVDRAEPGLGDGDDSNGRAWRLVAGLRDTSLPRAAQGALNLGRRFP